MEKTIHGGQGSNSLFGSNGDDMIVDPTGNDWIDGRFGNDSISAGEGNDRVFGGVGNDHVFGDEGNDYLYGDMGRDNPRILGAAILGADNDKLYGGPGDDALFAGDGRDSLTGGAGHDTFVFQFHNPSSGVDKNFGPNPDHTTIVDFDPAQDTFAFDAVGLGSDGHDANFVNHAARGNQVDTFYSGPADGAHGEHVVVITDRSFADGSAAAKAISGEAAGDIIAYFDYSSMTADLGYVTSENHVDDFVHLGNVQSLLHLAGLGLTASDFMFC
ncbi:MULTISPECIES: calcium-binding protein [unclassified Sinorhizobium]|uniref:calcium-binding protein n=1 Tax=unclassified Sinorhizobium TaxID=2613772 RepID=UPI0024C27F80|nr:MULTISPECIES: calcium-binding protein [unclassified Sinorhizobium]MDK1378128.1 calcium-binding protein [Sinorhizobium sp. 6-70]MDK1482326.1 calcium-binding protein [Sinorhizobium sp. 6-117]